MQRGGKERSMPLANRCVMLASYCPPIEPRPPISRAIMGLRGHGAGFLPLPVQLWKSIRRGPRSDFLYPLPFSRSISSPIYEAHGTNSSELLSMGYCLCALPRSWNFNLHAAGCLSRLKTGPSILLRLKPATLAEKGLGTTATCKRNPF